MFHICNVKLIKNIWLQAFFNGRIFISRKCSNKKALNIEQLDQRGLLRVSGKEASSYIQGLITNDMRHLEEGACSMYAMFLNTKGRVMYDVIIYQAKEENTFFVESDSAGLTTLQKHLKLFRVHRKIDVDIIDDALKTWVIFQPDSLEIQSERDTDKSRDKPSLQGQIVSRSILDSKGLEDKNVQALRNKDGFVLCPDPRLSALGYRLLTPVGEDLASISTIIGRELQTSTNNLSYRGFRYRLGIGEGLDDLPPGKCFPLEANCDYLHGVSFHKGCYIGQELTARTHHTGVVRKRLMPLILDSAPNTKFVPDAPIQSGSEAKKAVGKLRGIEHSVGLGLLRITEALDASILRVLDVQGQTAKPTWWPQEAPKERSAVAKES